VVTTALPNKLYDSILYKKPLMASSGTYLGELAEKYKIGFTVDVTADNIAETIENYISNFDEEVFLEGCQRLLKRVLTEQETAETHIKKFFLS